jgi:hypothetical protein
LGNSANPLAGAIVQFILLSRRELRTAITRLLLYGCDVGKTRSQASEWVGVPKVRTSLGRGSDAATRTSQARIRALSAGLGNGRPSRRALTQVARRKRRGVDTSTYLGRVQVTGWPRASSYYYLQCRHLAGGDFHQGRTPIIHAPDPDQTSSPDAYSTTRVWTSLPA